MYIVIIIQGNVNEISESVHSYYFLVKSDIGKIKLAPFLLSMSFHFSCMVTLCYTSSSKRLCYMSTQHLHRTLISP